MIEQLNNYLSNNTCDYERDSKQEILLDEDRIQIYFSVDEDYDVWVSEVRQYTKDGDEIELELSDLSKLTYEVEDLIQEWVKPSDNTVHIEGRSYEI